MNNLGRVTDGYHTLIDRILELVRAVIEHSYGLLSSRMIGKAGLSGFSIAAFTTRRKSRKILRLFGRGSTPSFFPMLDNRLEESRLLGRPERQPAAILIVLGLQPPYVVEINDPGGYLRPTKRLSNGKTRWPWKPGGFGCYALAIPLITAVPCEPAD